MFWNSICRMVFDTYFNRLSFLVFAFPYIYLRELHFLIPCMTRSSSAPIDYSSSSPMDTGSLKHNKILTQDGYECWCVMRLRKCGKLTRGRTWRVLERMRSFSIGVRVYPWIDLRPLKSIPSLPLTKPLMSSSTMDQLGEKRVIVPRTKWGTLSCPSIVLFL